MAAEPVNEKMNAIEKKALVGLASLYALRMMGLFMVLPVMLTYGMALSGATAVWLGLALGAYGITQAIFQIPLGWLSDRIGRKPVIAGGLIVFAFGSVVAALANDVQWVVFGRVVQGAGAIASSTMALLTDLTREQFRTRALATIGITIGLSFTLSMMIGPWLAAVWGLGGIFWFTAGLAVSGLVVLYVLVPDPDHKEGILNQGNFWSDASRVLKMPQLLRLDFGILVLHMGLMATFVVIPLRLVDAGLAEQNHGWLYMPVMIVAFVLMVPFIVIAEKKKVIIPMFSAAIGLLIVTQVLFLVVDNTWLLLAFVLMLYFVAFNYLEAAMPSLLSRLVPIEVKGTALGVFNTSQFIGAAIGGGAGGFFFDRFGTNGVYAGVSVILLIWLLASRGQKLPESIEDITVTTPEPSEGDADWPTRISESLLQLDGVEFVEVHAESREASVKIDRGRVSVEKVRTLVNREMNSKESN